MGFAEVFGGLAGGLQGAITTGQNAEMIGKLARDPGFSDARYQNVDYMGDFTPEMYGVPDAAEYQTISEDPRTRDFQMQALARMQAFADQSAGSAEALGRYNAVSDANAIAAQREAGIRNQMAMRGQGGSGMEFVLQQQAGQDAANRAQSAALNAAQQAALQRLQGTQGVMAGASNVRGMDADVAARNAAIINAFNLYNTGQRNAANMANTDMRNGANMRNLNTRQGLAGTNTGINNQSMDRQDRNKLNTMQANRDWVSMYTGNNSRMPQYIGQAFQGVGAAGDTAANFMAGGMGDMGGKK